MIDFAGVDFLRRELSLRHAGVGIRIGAEGGDVREAAHALAVDQVVERVRGARFELSCIGPDAFGAGALHASGADAIDVEFRADRGVEGPEEVRAIAEDGYAVFDIFGAELGEIQCM